MKNIIVKCPAKINLFLNIVGKKDNMHLLNMINNTVDLYDVINISVLDDIDGNIKITCNNPVIPLDEKNSVYKALKLMVDTYNIKNSFAVHIEKNIPLEAGMGGESTDAAGIIVGINKVCDLSLSKEKLCELGSKIGADVPYCICGSGKVVKGIGEIISDTKIDYKYYVVIKPNYSMNTKEAFKKYDELVKKYEIIEPKIGHNDFELIIPDITSIKDELVLNGANCVNMTGSGTAVVGCFKDKITQEEAYNKLKDKYDTYKVKSCKGIEVFANVIETEHLILRKANKDDLEEIYINVWSDQKLANTMLWEVTKSIEEARERLDRTINYQNENNAFFVCLKENNVPIGFAGVREVEHKVYEDSGICIATAYQGKGYGKELVSALKYLVFDTLEANSFLYSCFTINEASRKLCLSQGFTYSHNSKIKRKWDNKEFELENYILNKEKYFN